MCFNTTFVTVLCILHFPGSAYMPVSIQLLLLFYSESLKCGSALISFNTTFVTVLYRRHSFTAVTGNVSIQLLLLFYSFYISWKFSLYSFNTTFVTVLSQLSPQLQSLFARFNTTFVTVLYIQNLQRENLIQVSIQLLLLFYKDGLVEKEITN